MSDEWNPNDPDATRVLYDLGAWSFDQQAELAAELADAEVSHTWDGAELVVPETHEAQADVIISQIEDRFGIRYDVAPGEGDGGGGDGDDEADDTLQPLDIPDGTPTTEYDLGEWPEADLQTITRALVSQRIAYLWDDDALVVPTSHEAVVESLLDMIENGEFGVGDEPEDEVADALPFETLTSFFLVGERLQRNPLDADGLEQLLAAIELAEPKRPPYGVDVRLWQRTCELADELAGALADSDEPDEVAAQDAAAELYTLLRPFI